MSEQQLSDNDAGDQSANKIMSGRNTPMEVLATTSMNWLGAEGIVVFPEGGSDVTPR